MRRISTCLAPWPCQSPDPLPPSPKLHVEPSAPPCHATLCPPAPSGCRSRRCGGGRCTTTRPRDPPQRHPDADLAGAAGDVVRHAAVETHAGDRQRQDREATAQLGKRDLLVDLIVRSMSAVWVHNQGYPQPDQMVYALRTSGDRTNTGYYATGGMSLVRAP